MTGQGSSWRLVGLGLAAAGFAALAVYFADRHVTRMVADQQAAMRKPEPATTAVVVAKFDLVAGEAVGLENMAIRRIPADVAPTSALRPEQFDAKVGMRLTRAIRSGEPLLSEILQVADSGGLSARVRQGIRAITIAVDDVNAVSGMLRPGDRIDLLFSAKGGAAEGGGAVESARVLIQDVTVLATGRQLRASADDPNGRGFTSITVEMTPDDAKRLVVAQRTGRITALLRNPDDRHLVSTSVLDANTLLGTPRPPAPLPVRPVGPNGPEMIIGGNGSLAGVRRPVGQEAVPPAELGHTVAPVASRPQPPGIASGAGIPSINNGVSPPAAQTPPFTLPPVPIPTQPILFR